MKQKASKLPSAIAKIKTVQEVHEYYQKIISHMPNNVYWLDRNCITQGCNDNVLKFIGLKTLDEFVGINYEKMAELAGWTEGHEELYKQHDLMVMSSGTPILNIEDPPLHDKNGEPVYYLTSRVPVFDDKNQKVMGVVGISVNITDRKKMEEKLRQAKIAEAVNHAKNEFIANMSHDIRTPVTGMLGMSKMLEDKATDPEQKQYSHWLGESSTQLLEMLNGVLDVISADNVREEDLH